MASLVASVKQADIRPMDLRRGRSESIGVAVGLAHTGDAGGTLGCTCNEDRFIALCDKCKLQPRELLSGGGNTYEVSGTLRLI